MKSSRTTALLLGLWPVEGQRLALIYLPRLEVQDSHSVHFHIVEAEFGIGAAVSLGEETTGFTEPHGWHAMGLRTNVWRPRPTSHPGIANVDVGVPPSH